MKELIRFSLKRRFKNNSTIAFNIILIIALLLITFSDNLINVFIPDMLKDEIIYTKNVNDELLQFLNESSDSNYTFKTTTKKVETIVNDGNDVLEYKNNKYIIHSKYELNAGTVSLFNMYLTSYKRNALMNNSDNIELLNKYNEEVTIKNKVYQKNIDISEDKSNIIFMFVTSIYFMMLSFVSAVAGEVVNEKATKTLELILTSVSAKIHFISKMIVGWLVIIIQSGLTMSYVVFLLVLRSIYDNCEGLINLINKIGLLHIKEKNIYQLINGLGINSDLIIRLIYIIIFLMLGILVIQLFLVVISSFVSSAEEAGNIQAPFYLVLLAIYYLTLYLNNPHDLSEGLGYYLSFIPVFNMLLMPCRILIENVPYFEMFVSAIISSALILLVGIKGSKIYERGVLDYSCKGLIQIIKRMKD